MQNESFEVDVTTHQQTSDNNQQAETGAKQNVQAAKIPYAERLKVNKEIVEFLAANYPNCFTVEGEAKPLKVGIFQDMVEQETISSKFSKTLLRAALRYYTMSWRYLNSIKEGAERVDLMGNVSGVLDASHVEHAQQQLVEAKKRVDARKLERIKQSKKTASPNRGKQNNQTVDKASADDSSSDTQRLANRQKVSTASKKFPSSAKQSKPVASNQSSQSRKSDNSQVIKHSPENNQKAVLVTGNTATTDIKQLHIGQQVDVVLAKTRSRAEIVEIMKDSVKVNLSSGLSLNVGLEHIYL